jgi:two-component system phosphate regulon sensor histidine kinase PhoR
LEDEGKAYSHWSKLERIFDILDVGFSVHDAGGDILEANEALGRILGIPPEELIGKKCYQVFHYKDEFKKGCPMVKGVMSKKPENAEFFLHHSNRWVSFLTVPIIDDEGEVLKAVHVVRDVTEQKRMEKAYDDIKMLDKMKEELVTNVTHELRTPLQVVQAALEMVSDDVSDEGKRDLLDKGLENLDRLNDLIADIMKAVQLREKTLPHQEIVDIDKPIHPLLIPVEVVERKPVDMAELIKKCATRFSQEAEKKEITVEYQIDEDLPQILGDEKELDMAFSHLISNAIKFNEKGGKVSLEIQGMGDRIVMNVSDTGAGIPEKKLPKIFDRFYQVDGSTTRKHEGIGIGLYLVKNILEKHSGSIWVESEVGSGSKFISVLPAM